MNRICILVVLLFPFFTQASEQAPAERIVALSPHGVELLFSLGVGDRIIATTDYADYPEAANDIERVGGYHGVEIERIVMLQPDLIVAWADGNKAEEIEKLISLGLPVYESHTKNLNGIKTELNALGKLTGTQEKAKSLISDFEEFLARIQKQNENKSKVSFFYQLWQNPIQTISEHSWINEIMDLCGGQNIITREKYDIGYPQIGIETVLINKPQVIIIPSEHGAVTNVDSIWNDWQEIPAVKNKHIFKINGDILHRFSLRVTQGIDQTCSLFDRARNT
ncbi:cobalamin-binding protein [Bermanella sp. R86510]|uniref:cobalamin-binding protein n=1 Tax=unclassified Bermanella TaxID=2627862 RepID=UPI0037CBF8B3